MRATLFGWTLTWTIIAVILVFKSAIALPNPNPSHSRSGRCSGVECNKNPGNCKPTYERDDGCCAVWHCNDGQGKEYESYGRSQHGGNSFSSNSFGSSGGMAQMPGMNMQQPQMQPGFPGISLPLPQINLGGMLGRLLGG